MMGKNGTKIKLRGDRMNREYQNNDEGNMKQALSALRKKYEEIEMPKEQVRGLKLRMKEANMEENKKARAGYLRRMAAAAAVFVMAFIILPNTSQTIAEAMGNIPVIGSLVKVVTFRGYTYESEKNTADVKIPQITLKEDEAATGGAAADNFKKSADEINAEIKEISDNIIAEFKDSISEEGYQSIMVSSEVLATTDKYFTLKLICYQGSGSGYEWNYYYTIDLETGKRMALKDIFTDGADYITPISENIKEQMREQMKADANVMYWVDNEEVGDWNFKSIDEDTSFYINEEGNVVIGFDEGDVAPMYMGTVEFVIPDDVLSGIRK